ncbi:formin-like protein 3 [Panicum virgatum]|uniref:formin-like protein 3 n=1 Tax=Panicum virgatum TaxID=38727 RepID=UPI0019D5EFC5|nr:formin-like protein 3 [Panicum virgatum]
MNLAPTGGPGLGQWVPHPRFIFIGNFSALSSLPVHAPPLSTDTIDPKGKQKASIPSASSPPRSSSSSSDGSDAPPASSVRRSGYPSPSAKRQCPGIDPAASAVPPPPPPPPRGSAGNGPGHRAPSPLPPPQGHVEEPLRFSKRFAASG